MSEPRPAKPCAITVDVDGLDLYARLHGLPASVAGPQAWTRGVRRFLDLFDRRGIRATLFIVGQDVAVAGPARDLAQEAARKGHELANHTLTHPFDLVRRSVEAQRREVAGGAEAIEGATGRAPIGFRAPGYTVSEQLLEVVAESGHDYDASALPCPAYVLAKSAVMAGLRLRGRESSAIEGGLAAAAGPRRPHRASQGGGLLRIPISTTPFTRLPLFGATLAALGPRWLKAVLPGLLASLPLLHVELHAVDLVGVLEDGLHPSLAVRPDPGSRSLRSKALRLEMCLDVLAQACRFETLASARLSLP